MRYDLAAFDFDGTLADSFPWFARVLDEVALRFGFRRIDAAEREALRLCGSREILHRLGVPLWKLPMIAAHMRRLKAAAAEEMPLFPGVEGLLRQLSGRGMALAMVSSDSEANIRRVLGPGGAACFGQYECGASIFGKAARLRRVLRRSGVPEGRAIYIGDEVRDAEAARRAGIAFGAVAWGYARPEALLAEAPAAFFTSLDEIAGTIG